MSTNDYTQGDLLAIHVLGAGQTSAMDGAPERRGIEPIQVSQETLAFLRDIRKTTAKSASKPKKGRAKR